MKEYGISYQREGQEIKGYAHNLAGSTDVDFASDKDDHKSTCGWLFTFNSAPISWESKKQKLVSRSSMESKLIAVSFASAEGIWFNKLGNNFHIRFIPIPIFTDNQSAITFQKENQQLSN